MIPLYKYILRLFKQKDNIQPIQQVEGSPEDRFSKYFRFKYLCYMAKQGYFIQYIFLDNDKTEYTFLKFNYADEACEIYDTDDKGNNRYFEVPCNKIDYPVFYPKL